MDLRNKTLLFVSQYAALYEGNFILSLKALEQELRNKYHAKVVYVFPFESHTKKWMPDFEKVHKTYFITEKSRNGILKQLENIMEEVRPQLVHTHFDGFDIPVVKAVRHLQKKLGVRIEIVWHLHDELRFHKNWLKAIYQFYCFLRHYHYYGRKVSTIAVGARVCRFTNAFKQLAIGKWKFSHPYRYNELIPNGIDLKRFEPIKAATDRHLTPFTFLAYGGRNAQKRVDLLFEAGKIAASKGLDFKCIITQGVDTQQVVHGGGKMHWLDIVRPTDNIVELFEKSSCFVSTSAYETFSYAIAEASIWGLPVIQSDIEGTMWNAENPSCFLFRSGDASHLAYVMETVMNMDKEKLAAACRKSQQNNIDRYNIGTWTNRIIAFYEKIK